MLGATVLFVYLLIRILAAPIKWIFKLALNGALGFVVLFVFNLIGDLVGITIPITVPTALITGFFGIPGVLFLILLQVLY